MFKGINKWKMLVIDIAPRFGKKETLQLIVPCLVGIAAVWFRLWQLPIQLLADDEWHALNKLLESNALGIYTSFGQADHSIPLTLYYYFISLATPLTENIMRFPMVIAGMATLVVVPIFCRRLLNRQELMVLFILLALSPILIYYTRTARPYAISTLLTVIALLAFYYWAVKPRIFYAIVYLCCSSVSAWMQPVTLVFLLTPFLFYGGKSLYLWWQAQQGTLLWRLVVMGGVQLISLTVLLGPPIYRSLADISGKTGVDSPTLESITETFKLLAGSEYTLYLLAFVIFALAGIHTLWKRNSEFTFYLLLCTVIPFLLILSSGAAWIQHSLVTARYSLPVLILMAITTAVGVVQVLRWVNHSMIVQTIGIGLLAIGIYAAGPLHRQYAQDINQFTGHMAYQFDYDWEGNEYNITLDNRPVSPFYEQLGERPAKQLNLVIVPWFMEWHKNRWYLDQMVHQQIVTAGFLEGFCDKSFYGEYAPDNHQVSLDNAVPIKELKADRFDYLVYHKKASREDLDISDYAQCLEKIRATFGMPEYEDDELIAYRLKGG